MRLFPLNWIRYKRILNAPYQSYVVLQPTPSNRFSTALAVKSTNPLDDATGFYYLGKHVFGSKEEAEKHFQDRKDY